MRVIAGKARRIPLKTMDGLNTRPTTDRIKETLFNIIQDDIYGCRFLDLFSGSGGIGIEALSRGAKEAFLCADVFEALRRLSATEAAMDIIFMDPPYNESLEKDVLAMLSSSPLADASTLIIVEADLSADFSYADSLGFDIIREKKYKTNKHMFLMKKQDGEKV